MHLAPIVNGVRATLLNQASLAAGDPTIDAAVAQLVDGLEPALRQAALDLAQQAAAEVAAQLGDRTVDVVLSDGDPSLRITESGGGSTTTSEEFDARITLRLPPSLKQIIEDSAGQDGESVNSWVVDALSRRTSRSATRGRRVTEAFDL